MDALGVLRDFTVRNDLGSIRLIDGEVRFGDDYRFPAHLETAYRNKQGGHYTLESLVFFVKNTALKHTEYLQQARSLKLQIVTFTDRMPLLDYLEGRVSTNEAIELLAGYTGAVTGVGVGVGGTRAVADEDARPHKRLHHDPSSAFSLEQTGTDGVTEGVRDAICLFDQERPFLNRETILLCQSKSFRSILEALNRKDDDRKKLVEEHQPQQQQPPQQHRKDASEKTAATAAATAAVGATGLSAATSGNRFAETEEKTFWKEHLGTDAAEELGIDPTQSYIADGTAQHKDSMSHSSWNHYRAQPRPHHHRASVGLATQSLRHDASPGIPIILVPSASQTLLNTFNAKEFLEDGVYVPPHMKAGTMKKTEIVAIHRKIGREQPIKYEVRDKPSTLASKDWERVVAVFVLGKEWQFKDWPFKDHAEIFNRTLGVYLRFEDDSVESAKVVQKWNVRIISLSKHKRHQDRTAVLEFWDRLDAFVRARKSNLIC